MRRRLSEAGVDPGTEDDMIFRWQRADGEMGLRSSHEALMTLAMSGGQRSARLEDIGYKDPRALFAASRVGRIEAGLRAAGPDATRILRVAYGERLRENRWPFGPAGNLVEATDAAREAHARSRSRRPLRAWIDRISARLSSGLAEARERDLAFQLQHAAETLLIDAARRYAPPRRRRCG